MNIDISVTNARFAVTNDAGETIASGRVDNYAVSVEASKLGVAIGELMGKMELTQLANEIKVRKAQAAAVAGD